MTLDAIHKFGDGVITASPTDLSISQILAAPSTVASSFGLSLLSIKGSLYVNYNNVWFDNNWKLETNSY